MSVGYVYHPIYLKHDTGTHVENARRLEAIMGYLERKGLKDTLKPISPRAASQEELELVHDSRYISYIKEVISRGGGWLDADTLTSPDSYEAASYAAGGLICAVDAVLKGEVRSVFALVRPPGHHATSRRAMGFCLFNNVAIAAKHAIKNYGLERIAIIDFDVHHGNGTQDTFFSDPRVLYLSTHQAPFYPGTGRVEEVGEGEGEGATVNIPLPSGCGDEEYLKVFDEVIIPAVRRYRPQLILVSAGYDPHWADPLAMMQLTTLGFAEIVKVIKNLATELCSGRLIFTLEGGYHLRALAESVGATLSVLLGKDEIEDSLGKPHQGVRAPDLTLLLKKVKEIHRLATSDS